MRKVHTSLVHTQVSSLKVIAPGESATDVGDDWRRGLPTSLRVLPGRLRLVGTTIGQKCGLLWR